MSLRLSKEHLPHQALLRFSYNRNKSSTPPVLQWRAAGYLCSTSYFSAGLPIKPFSSLRCHVSVCIRQSTSLMCLQHVGVSEYLIVLHSVLLQLTADNWNRERTVPVTRGLLYPHITDSSHKRGWSTTIRRNPEVTLREEARYKRVSTVFTLCGPTYETVHNREIYRDFSSVSTFGWGKKECYSKSVCFSSGW